MTRSIRTLIGLVTALAAAGFICAGAAAAADSTDATADPSDTATSTDVVVLPSDCFTYYPSGLPSGPFTDSGAATVTATAVPPGVGSATEADAAGSVDVTDSVDATDSVDPTDSALPSDTVEPTDTALPSGPYTACAAAAGGAGGGATQHRDPLAYSGSDTKLLAAIAAGLLVLGLTLSLATARYSNSRRTH
jgi:hypothetical protein